MSVPRRASLVSIASCLGLTLPVGCNSIAGLDALTLDRAPPTSSAGGAGGAAGGSGGALGGGGDANGGLGQGGAGGGTSPDGFLCATALPVDMGEGEWMRDAASDLEGGVVVVGQVKGTFEAMGIETAPADGQQAFIARLDSDCQPTYVKLWGGAADDLTEAVAIDSLGNAVVIGRFVGPASFDTNTLPTTGSGEDVFVAKIAPDGQLLWVRGSSDGTDDRGRRLAVGSDGSIVITGDFAGTFTMGNESVTAATGRDLFVAKLDSSGNTQWVTAFDSSGWQQADAMAIDPSGVIVIGGKFTNTASFGATTLVAQEQSDAFLALLDASGNPVWATGLGAEPFIDDWDHAAESIREVDFAPNGELVGLLKFAGALNLGGAGMLTSGPRKANARVTFHPATGVALSATMLPSPDSEQLRPSGIASPSSMVTARFVLEPFGALGPFAPFVGGRQLAIARHGAGTEIVEEVRFPLESFTSAPNLWVGAEPWLRVPGVAQNDAGDIFVVMTSAPSAGITEPFLKGRYGAFMMRLRL